MAENRHTKALMIYLNNREVLEALSDAERGQMTLALLDYLEYGTVPAFTGGMNMAFIILRKDVDRSVERWEEECKRRSEAGKKSAAVRAAKNFTPEVSSKSDSGEGQEEGSTEFNGAERRSAEGTYTNTNPNPNSNPNPNPNSNPNPNPNSNPNPYPKSGTRSKPSAGSPGGAAGFERFWQAYPRRVGKQAARRAFARAGVPLDRLLPALEQQKNDPQWQRENGRFIPNPATWLNQGRWEDEPGCAPPPCERFRVESL